jgi:rhodanese-related sulfurtransferase
VTVAEYAAWREEGKEHFLLDVRELEEYRLARIEGAALIPLHALPGRLDALPKDKPIVVLCHHGVRSAHAVHHLRAAGFDAVNLTGGIDAWSREVDAAVPTY